MEICVTWSQRVNSLTICFHGYISRSGRLNQCKCFQNIWKHVLCIVVGAKHPNAHGMDNYRMPFPRYIFLSDKSTHKPLFCWTSNMKRPQAVFCYSHPPLQEYPTHYLQKKREKESNTSNNKKRSESGNIRLVWGVSNSLVRHGTV